MCLSETACLDKTVDCVDNCCLQESLVKETRHENLIVNSVLEEGVESVLNSIFNQTCTDIQMVMEIMDKPR